MAQKKKNGVMCGHGPVSGAKCPDSDKEYKIGGPYWMDPIHDIKFVKEIVQRVENEKGPFEPGTKTRIHGMLTAVSEELPDVPLFYRLPDLCEALHCASPRLPAVKAALINAGYRVSHFHKDPDALKTNAPPNVLWDVLRCWVKDHPVNPKRLQPGSLAHTLLSKEPELRADFSLPKELRPRAVKKAKRFAPNPEDHWGPKRRATGIKKARIDQDDKEVPPVLEEEGNK